MPAYKRIKKIFQGKGPFGWNFGFLVALGLSFVPFQGKIKFGIETRKAIQMLIAPQGGYICSERGQFPLGMD